jgi:PelA/Pel-15E family pectate lyase
MNTYWRWLSVLVCCWLLSVVHLPSLRAQLSQENNLAAIAQETLRNASRFYQTKVAVHGGYVYQVSADLRYREGEGDAGPLAVWVQPPGTPSVGMAFLEAYQRTKEPSLLKGAESAAECLVQGQLHSGGWQNHIDFDPILRTKLAYRVEPNPTKRARNYSSFDDDQTQSAIRFLASYDATTGFANTSVHSSVLFALDAVVRNQHPNGAWGQVFGNQLANANHKTVPAQYPEEWLRQHPGTDYWLFYTLNDNVMARVIQTMWLAYELYGEERYRESAIRGADFLLLAQMPDPQPAWSQQYNFDMHPVWARKFEPPAISGGESQAVIETLLNTYARTGDAKYLATLDKALAYLEGSVLPNGKLARFYELKTNRPLYFTKSYKLTYSDDDMPTHYGFQVPSNLGRLKKQLAKWREMPLSKLKDLIAKGKDQHEKPKLDELKQVLTSINAEGAWVETGKLKYVKAKDHDGRVIRSETFARNLDTLSRFLATPE